MTEQTFDLGFIGHNAEKIKALFSGYSEMPNQYGKFLKFENYTEYAVNEGVTAYTNCFEDEKHFNDTLTLKLLVNYLEL
jgi:hypothetical protein